MKVIFIYLFSFEGYLKKIKQNPLKCDMHVILKNKLRFKKKKISEWT